MQLAGGATGVEEHNITVCWRGETVTPRSLLPYNHSHGAHNASLIHTFPAGDKTAAQLTTPAERVSGTRWFVIVNFVPAVGSRRLFPTASASPLRHCHPRGGCIRRRGRPCPHSRGRSDCRTDSGPGQGH